MVSRAYQFNFDIEEDEFDDIDELVDIAEDGINAVLNKLKVMKIEDFLKLLESDNPTIDVSNYEEAIGSCILLEYLRRNYSG